MGVSLHTSSVKATALNIPSGNDQRLQPAVPGVYFPSVAGKQGLFSLAGYSSAQ